MAKLDERIGFIGGGNMAFAIGSGLIERGIVKSSQVIVSGPNIGNLQKWRDLGAAATDDNGEVVSKCDITFICVKPHLLATAADQVRRSIAPAAMDKDKILVSVLAGCTLEQLERVGKETCWSAGGTVFFYSLVLQAFSFLHKLKMIRSMPNTPMQVGEGCTTYTPGSNVTQSDIEKVQLILGSLGVAQQVPEKLINPSGALAGCGPAFVRLFGIRFWNSNYL